MVGEFTISVSLLVGEFTVGENPPQPCKASVFMVGDGYLEERKKERNMTNF
jgi:hypothetical protein